MNKELAEHSEFILELGFVRIPYFYLNWDEEGGLLNFILDIRP